MPRRSYTVTIADRLTGVERRLALRPRAVALALVAALTLPVLTALAALWGARFEVEQLRAVIAALEIENVNFRASTVELTSQVQALGTLLEDLGSRAAIDPAELRSLQRLPAVVRNSAAGGVRQPTAPIGMFSSTIVSPEETFGVLRTLLHSLENRLRTVRGDLERQEALAAATPTIWPTYGWLTGYFGQRADPVTGEPGFHQGLDISAAKGQPVYATADGTVASASYAGEYGNLIVLRHNFGLSTRYGHLSRFNVTPGTTVRRGDIIGFVGSTGRSTGAHLHYEVLANDRLLNPLQLLTSRRPAPR
jgi:murein DD-endopeptidase MepM/ murein hydrolase activator NlpD